MKEYTIQGKDIYKDFEAFGWMALSRAEGVKIPYMVTIEKAMEVLRQINERKDPDSAAQYRIVTRQVTEWEEAAQYAV